MPSSVYFQEHLTILKQNGSSIASGCLHRLFNYLMCELLNIQLNRTGKMGEGEGEWGGRGERGEGEEEKFNIFEIFSSSVVHSVA